MLCSLLGLVAGTAAAYLAGIIPGEAISRIAHAPLFALPNAAHIGYAFHPVLAIPFAVCAVAAALRTIGVVTTSQQINNSNWTRPDQKSIAGGVLADGLGCVIGGLLGAAPGMSSSPSAVGVAKATGATSRYIALAICGWFLVLACLPKLAAVFLALPLSVVGAGLVFSGSFITVSGVKIIAAHDFDTRRTFTIGIPLFLALGQEAFRTYFEALPGLLRSITDSMLSVATVAAILLNLVFRIGNRRSYAAEVRLVDGSGDALGHALQERGKKWGIGPDVVGRAAEASSQILDLIQDRHLADGPVRATVSFDETDFTVDVAYHGTALHLPPHRLQPKELVEEEAFSSGLAGYLVGVHPDRVRVTAKDSECHIRLEFWS
jgi:NCS2 family nucleobase:cation symporter-2